MTMKASLLILLFSCGLSSGLFAEEPLPQSSVSISSWSNVDDGLKARFFLETQTNRPHLKVSVEFENVSKVAGMMRIPFEPANLQLQVVDEDGALLKPLVAPDYSALTPVWEPLLLPFDGTIKFNISFPGLAFKPGVHKTILDLGPSSSWYIPDHPRYYLQAAIKFPNQPSKPMPKGKTLKIPQVLIPLNKK